MDWLKIMWIVLFVLLLLFPIWYVLFYLYKVILKALKEWRKKVQNIKAMDDMRKDLLRQKAEDIKKEIQEETAQDLSKNESSTHSTNNEETTNIQEKTEELVLDEKERKELNKIIYDADLLKKDGKLDEYEKKLIEWLSMEPTNKLLNKNLAEYYFNMWNHKKALQLFKSITEKYPDDHSAVWHLGQIYLMWKDYKMAEILIEKAIHIVWDNPKYHISMVEIYYNTDRKLQAIGIMEKIIKLRPSNTNYMIALAELYEEVDDEKNAKKYYFRVLENEPNNEIAKSKIQLK